MTFEDYYGDDYARLINAENILKQIAEHLCENSGDDKDVTPIVYYCSRIKKPDSMIKKLKSRDLPTSKESALTNVYDAVGLRIICAFSDDVKNIISKYLMFQRVEGALVQFLLEPETKVSMSIEFKAAKLPFIYKVNGTADKNGFCEFRLPYANDYDSGEVKTDPFYKVSFEKDGIRKMAKLTVPEEAVVEGLTLETEKHLSYLSTF